MNWGGTSQLCLDGVTQPAPQMKQGGGIGGFNPCASRLFLLF
jgi:hypothetical protein